MTGARASVRLRFYEGVPLDAKRRVQALVRQLRPRASRPLSITVVRHEAVGDGDEQGFGATVLRKDAAPRIILAAGIVGVTVAHGGTRADGLKDLESTLAHEWLHYEDWCAGRKPTHARMWDRVRALLRKVHP